MELSNYSIKNIIQFNYSKITKNTYDAVHIGYGIDNNFARCTATSIVSFCLNNPKQNIIFHIIESDLSNINIDKFQELARNLKINLNIYEINIEYFKSLPSNLSYTTAMYYRFILPFILKDVKKIIYIDGDTLCLNDATKLFSINLENNIIAAVPDKEWANIERNRVLKLENHTYFLSGMMIINVKKWNTFNTFDKLLQALSYNHNKFTLPDQDALNLILTKNIKYIEPIYNWAELEHITDKDMSNIIILHFAASPKPWHLSWSIHPRINNLIKNLYYDYEKLTPFFNMPLINPRNYKEMEHHAKYLKKDKQYFSSFKWYIKYLKNKFLNC